MKKNEFFGHLGIKSHVKTKIVLHKFGKILIKIIFLRFLENREPFCAVFSKICTFKRRKYHTLCKNGSNALQQYYTLNDKIIENLRCNQDLA